MIKNKKRKEIRLDDKTISLLQLQAEKEGRKLKNYMEYILVEKAKEFEISEAYKSQMDKTLKQHEKEELNYQTKEAFFKTIERK